MSLFLVSNPEGVPVWIADVDDELRVWSYVHNTGHFHLNRGLFLDYHWEQNNRYEPLSVTAAEAAIAGGLTTLIPRRHSHLLKTFFADSSPRTLEDVLAEERRAKP